MCDPKQDSVHNYSNLHLLQFHLDEISLLFDPLIAMWCGALHNEETEARHSLILVQKVFFSWQWRPRVKLWQILGWILHSLQQLCPSTKRLIRYTSYTQGTCHGEEILSWLLLQNSWYCRFVPQFICTKSLDKSLPAQRWSIANL